MFENIISDILKNNVYTKKYFLGVYARDELPGRVKTFPSFLVFNTRERGESGEHWLALYFNRFGYCTFFDSYGLHPKNYDMVSYLTKINCNSWTWNKTGLQGSSYFCGHYCIIYIYFRCRHKNKDFYRFFTKNSYKNDLFIQTLLDLI